MQKVCILRCCTGNLMIGFLGNKSFCDLMCFACIGYVQRACLFCGGANMGMRMLAIKCLAKGEPCPDIKEGLWSECEVLSVIELPGITFPNYLDETEN